MIKKLISKVLSTTLSNPPAEYKVQNIFFVDSKKLLYNFDIFQRLSANVFPVLKSNAYGHGIKEIAKILNQRDFPYIIVDGFHEASQIREVSSKPILVMGYIDPANFVNIDLTNTALVVQSPEVINELGKLNKKVKIHLEINTGMNRWGVSPEEVLKYAYLIKSFPNLEFEGVMSHLADADGESEEYTKYQTVIFDMCVEELIKIGVKPKFINISNSAGSCKNYSRYTNSIRPGLAMYGITPFEEGDKHNQLLSGLAPVGSLYSKIIKIINLKQGEKIGYNCTFKAQKDSAIAVIPLGYYEGIDRRLSSKGYVRISKQSMSPEPNYVPIVGRVSMNITMIDVTDFDCKVGDNIEVFSANPNYKNSFANIAKLIGDIPYTSMVHINDTIRRRVI
jgi:alanine racemase